jgi:hypothetical protein
VPTLVSCLPSSSRSSESSFNGPSADSAIAAATRQTTAFNTMKRTSTLLQSARTKVSPIGAQAKRAYSSEMANALVQVSQNLGMGSAAIGLGGAGKPSSGPRHV